MKLSDFHIGLIFNTCLGRWKCTDVGTRTVTAIHLDDERYSNDPRWTEGPPYGLDEQTFNENDIDRAFRSLEEAIAPRLEEGRFQRSYPSEVAFAHIKRHIEIEAQKKKGGPDAYPVNTLVGTRMKDGEAFSAHGAHKDTAGQWIIECFNFHQQMDTTLTEVEWFALSLLPRGE